MMLLKIFLFSCCLLVYAETRRHKCCSRHPRDPRCPRYPRCLQCQPPWPKKAVCVMQNGTVLGTIWFEQQEGSNSVTVTGHMEYLKPGKHGIHVHEYGDITNGCTSCGGHYNPFNKKHGAPEDEERHVGDLGNINADKHGTAYINKTDRMMRLCGPLSIMGRSVVVHENKDDLGKGGDEASEKCGKAGIRLGCCVIGLAH